MTGFQHDIAGGQGVLIVDQLQSPNFVQSPLTGWAVLKNGAAYFADLTLSGTFMGTNYEINSAGIFFYSGTPAAGNLVLSSAEGSGTDQYGNNYASGVTAYASDAAVSMQAGNLDFLVGSLSAGWSSAGYFSATSGALTIDFTGVTATGNLTVDGTLSVNGSTSTSTDGLPNGGIEGTSDTAGLPNGDISGTSGAASAGTAHTHSAGSYAVTNGVHDHGPGSFSVTDGQHSHTL
jgi:hypothetical protein